MRFFVLNSKGLGLDVWRWERKVGREKGWILVVDVVVCSENVGEGCENCGNGERWVGMGLGVLIDGVVEEIGKGEEDWLLGCGVWVGMRVWKYWLRGMRNCLVICWKCVWRVLFFVGFIL